jgi:hypothetical protein
MGIDPLLPQLRLAMGSRIEQPNILEDIHNGSHLILPLIHTHGFRCRVQ